MQYLFQIKNEALQNDVIYHGDVSPYIEGDLLTGINVLTDAGAVQKSHNGNRQIFITEKGLVAAAEFHGVFVITNKYYDEALEKEHEDLKSICTTIGTDFYFYEVVETEPVRLPADSIVNYVNTLPVNTDELTCLSNYDTKVITHSTINLDVNAAIVGNTVAAIYIGDLVIAGKGFTITRSRGMRINRNIVYHSNKELTLDTMFNINAFIAKELLVPANKISSLYVTRKSVLCELNNVNENTTFNFHSTNELFKTRGTLVDACETRRGYRRNGRRGLGRN